MTLKEQIKQVLLLSVDELWLKGQNQGFYAKLLLHHIRHVVKKLELTHTEVFRQNERFLIRLGVSPDQPPTEEIISAMQKIAGINQVMPADVLPLDYDFLLANIGEVVKEYVGEHKTFAVNSRRANKGFAVKSDVLNREVGAAIWQKFQHLKVNLTKPDLEIFLRVLNDGIYVYCQKFEGLGGLPISSSGRLLTLLSGGIDSPVASVMMAKRGCAQDFIFFYAYPFVDESVKEKIKTLSAILAKYQVKSKLHIVPIGRLQEKIAMSCLAPYRTLLFRVLMVTIAQSISQKTHIQALITGDSLGQVSSQTLENIAIIDQVASMSIFRPLIGLNKLEITRLAQKFHTYETSIIPHDDACSLLAPKQPIIRGQLNYVQEYLASQNFQNDIEEAITTREVIYL